MLSFFCEINMLFLIINSNIFIICYVNVSNLKIPVLFIFFCENNFEIVNLDANNRLDISVIASKYLNA